MLHSVQKSSSCRKSGQGRDHLDPKDLVWALGSLCALHRLPFDPSLLLKQCPSPTSLETLIEAGRALGFKIKLLETETSQLEKQLLPCIALVQRTSGDSGDCCAEDVMQPKVTLALITEVRAESIRYFEAGSNVPQEAPISEFDAAYTGALLLVTRSADAVNDPDAIASKKERFGFLWFIPELMRHKSLWRDVLTASLVIQLLALGTPLFTQAIIDKVVVHRTESTLIAIAVGMSLFMLFTAALTWVRQYMVLHTGNRVDAVLAASVFEHLFQLPPRYFEHRPTGVIATRLQGVESIREFIASAAVTLILDLPFLFIFVAIMFVYSVKLTLIVLAIMAVVAVISLAVAPIFQRQMNEQFLLGARNQAFLTEYIAGVETVKSLQMEPQLKSRFNDYLAEYLHSTFKTRQTANTYSTAATTLEQMMTLLILVVGAYTVMTQPEFTIGMLVAFQMFAGRVSQPMMRLVGLWQQFQQASLSVKRLGDLMNAPTEPYSLQPSRMREGQGRIEIANLGFRYGDNLPWLYRGLNVRIERGSTVAIMGPSGSGKSTLAKLLQGFYQPVDGGIRIDDIDIQNLSANELRHYFGVVPQETVLFSGTIYDNLLSANPHAGFEQVVEACKVAEIHTVIERLPNGYQSEIGERGAGLSGGQRQRIAIARALLKRPRILIFDEATSNLDPHTAEHFAATINQLRGKATMIFITHALPKNLLVDEVVRIGGESLTVVNGDYSVREAKTTREEEA